MRSATSEGGGRSESPPSWRTEAIGAALFDGSRAGGELALNASGSINPAGAFTGSVEGLLSPDSDCNADISASPSRAKTRHWPVSFDDLVGSGEQRVWYRDT
jgi:hypothetical protein